MPWTAPNANVETPWQSIKRTRDTIRQSFPCFGHFSRMYCFNLGFVGPCPYERLCRKDKELDDLARKGKIERPGIEALDYSSKNVGSLKGRTNNLKDLETTRKRKLERARRGYEELGGDPDRLGINQVGGIYIKHK